MDFTSTTATRASQDFNSTSPRDNPRPSSSKSNDTYTSIYSEYIEHDSKRDSTFAFSKHSSWPSMTPLLPPAEPARALWSDACDLILEYNGLKHRKIGFENEPHSTNYQRVRVIELIDAIAVCEKHLDDVAVGLGMAREAIMEDRRSRERGPGVGRVKFCLWMVAFLGVALAPLVLLPANWWVLKDAEFESQNV